jgi:Superfamily II DNA helicase
LLLSYFGEKSAIDCGHCDVCLEKKRNQKPSDIDRIIRDVSAYLQSHSVTITYLIEHLDCPEKDVLIALRYMIDSKLIKRNGDWIGIC